MIYLPVFTNKTRKLFCASISSLSGIISIMHPPVLKWAGSELEKEGCKPSIATAKLPETVCQRSVKLKYDMLLVRY